MQNTPIQISIHSTPTLSILVHTWHYMKSYYHSYEKSLKNELILHAPFVSKGLYLMSKLYYNANSHYASIDKRHRFLKICQDAVNNKLPRSITTIVQEIKTT